ncbi:hypothetical protein Hamer_G028455 [Homarus americanus]|uniref:Uncharacterized protein n=1 Tax=Homarus americanus TaxID=6706 RepID=A0A8J5MK41_HOMAM|nr:hypothetical protein Hamer_G028455 [Homarus americanus]
MSSQGRGGDYLFWSTRHYRLHRSGSHDGADGKCPEVLRMSTRFTSYDNPRMEAVVAVYLCGHWASLPPLFSGSPDLSGRILSLRFSHLAFTRRQNDAKQQNVNRW